MADRALSPEDRFSPLHHPGKTDRAAALAVGSMISGLLAGAVVFGVLLLSLGGPAA